MGQPKSEAMPVAFSITIADASNLPIHHVNALALRTSTDEFFFTLGVVMPPDQVEMAAAAEVGHLVAQPIFRFAVSRDTMEKFLNLMIGQYDQQTTLMQRWQHLGEETDKEKGDRDEQT